MAWSRDAAWDIGVGDRDRERAFIENSWTLGAVKSIGAIALLQSFSADSPQLRQVKVAVTE
jgi:hypothetical protein